MVRIASVENVNIVEDSTMWQINCVDLIVCGHDKSNDYQQPIHCLSPHTYLLTFSFHWQDNWVTLYFMIAEGVLLLFFKVFSYKIN